MSNDNGGTVAHERRLREREQKERALRTEWNLNYGPEYIQACADSQGITDQCREKVGLPPRKVLDNSDVMARIPAPYRRAVQTKTETDMIGLYEDDFDQRLFSPHEHGIKRTVFD